MLLYGAVLTRPYPAIGFYVLYIAVGIAGSLMQEMQLIAAACPEKAIGIPLIVAIAEEIQIIIPALHIRIISRGLFYLPQGIHRIVIIPRQQCVDGQQIRYACDAGQDKFPVFGCRGSGIPSAK